MYKEIKSNKGNKTRTADAIDNMSINVSSRNRNDKNGMGVGGKVRSKTSVKHLGLRKTTCISDETNSCN